MKRTLLADGWQFRPKVNPFAELAGAHSPFVDVAVPHDAIIGGRRDPDGDGAVAYFPGGAFQYRTTFASPAGPAEDQVSIEFEGVYRDGMVYINGHFAGQNPSGYSSFVIDATPHLRPREQNELLVEARAHKDSRWYSGAGIYRNVWLLTGGSLHIAPSGLRVSASDVDAQGATADVTVTLENAGARSRTVDLLVSIHGPAGIEVAGGVVVVTVPPASSAIARQRLYIAAPELWSAESPSLYTVAARVVEADVVLDAAAATSGIRRLQLDPVNGLRVNGQCVKLRGACVHHDNGILGAATFPAAEERRVRLLKAAGFNAIRSSHNPISSAMLDACDRLGMYVVDETFDVWTSGKTEFDYSLHFAEWWERDVASMIAKDFNHPSVLMYSIGNEIPETGSPAGGMLGRALAEKVRELDPTRFVTNAINGMLAVLPDLRAMAANRARTEDATGVNTAMANAGDTMNAIGRSDLVTTKTAESFGVLDVAGMNYLDGRYVQDRQLFPNRVILGTETFPPRIDGNWALVRDNSHVIGDFTWTGWDYLGEVGIGRTRYANGADPTSFAAPYPWIGAWCGDIDLVGFRRPMSYYREIVFGLRTAPFIAVLRPGQGEISAPNPWAWSDSISSWTWTASPGPPGPVDVEVYGDADEVELVLNGRSLGRVPAGPGNRFKSVFSVDYEPGELTAIAYRAGAEVGRHSVRTATGATSLRVRADRSQVELGSGGLTFVDIELVDAEGNLFTDSDRSVTVELSGPAVLQALGSANPATEESYASSTHTTFDGRALAIIRPTEPGEITVRVSAPECATAEITLTANR